MVSLVHSPDSGISVPELAALHAYPITRFAYPKVPVPVNGNSLRDMHTAHAVSIAALFSPRYSSVQRASAAQSIISDDAPSVFIPPVSVPVRPYSQLLQYDLTFVTCAYLR